MAKAKSAAGATGATAKKAKPTAGAKPAKKTKPVMGAEVAARPGAKPLPKKALPKAKAGATIKQVDPLYIYNVNVFTGSAWLKVGEIWFNTSGTEYWGLYKSWNTWNHAPNLWIYPYDYATKYASLAAFKVHVNADDPDHNSSFLQITQTPV